MARRAGALGRLALALALVAAGGAWWWAVLRLLLVPERTGLVEGFVAAGGWGLSLLPVHVTAYRGRRGVRRVVGDLRGVVEDARGAVGAGVTRASARRRSDG
ncbi:hypothetical protein GCM10010232_55120 [Streptomyces amakusaensis]|uniref:Integral membrane protein n=1 Tax=Streptomyces amakusaensis TaxID=67271 RepID=A0ABW0AMB6_9ACTN